MRLTLSRAQQIMLRVLVLLMVGLNSLAVPASAEGIRGRQWHLDAMSADELWKSGKGAGVVVAVIDSGVNEVPELQGQVLEHKRTGSAPPREDVAGRSHGTAMASVIAGTGRSGGVKGLAPEAKIMSLETNHTELRIFGDSAVYPWIRAIKYAVDHGARVISISQSGTGISGEELRKLEAAIEYAHEKGALVFASTGNGAKEGNPLEYPAGFAAAVGVAAVDQSGKVADFSTYGSQVDFAAPGVGIPVRCGGGGAFCAQDGTSPATALASASAALIWSKHPTWTNNQVLRVMMQTASKPEGKVPSKYIGYGIIRPGQVLIDGKGDPGDPDVNPLLPKEKEQAKPTHQPSAAPSGSSPGSGKGSDSEDAQRAAEGVAASGGSGGGNGGSGLLWPVLGTGAGMAVIGGAVFYLRRRQPRSSMY
ncbi:S8 family serine peptidase [Streptomyces buecherae]|uniref:S8 family serine peptidase n=1 Tax=Streptomyces buecherae TaxID=2763006 RepID=UPI001C261FA8|nr:S8 family serine peptidase [Streptomyces buecherae]